MCQTDLAGNVGPAATLVFTLDRVTAAPTIVGLVSDTGIPTDKSTSNPALRLAGVESSDQVEYSFSGGGWSTTYTPGGDGTKSVQVRQTDLAGNVSPASAAFAFTLDTVAAAPGVALTHDTGISATDAITSNPALSLSGVETGAMVQYNVNGGGWSTTYTPGADGTKSVQVRQTDLAGNVSPAATLVFTIDTTPPAAPSVPVLDPSTDSGVPGDNVTNFNKPECTGTAEAGATVTIFSDGVAVGSGVAVGGNYSIVVTTALADGARSITAKAADPAGNTGVGSAALSVTIDTQAETPAVPVLDASTDSGAVGDNLTKFMLPKFDGTGQNGATVTIYTGGVAVGYSVVAAGTYHVTIATPLTPDGVYSVTAQATDLAGNTGAVSVRAEPDDRHDAACGSLGSGLGPEHGQRRGRRQRD